MIIHKIKSKALAPHARIQRNTRMLSQVFIIALTILTSCTKFVTVPPPKTELVSQTVFADDATAVSAMNGVYIHLMNTAESGNGASFSKYLGLYADELTNYSTIASQSEFYTNSLSASNGSVSNFWGQYTLIYLNNSILAALASSNSLSAAVKNELEGEAKFMRAFSNFYLVNLFGDVPIISTTNYEQNTLVARNSTDTVYKSIIQDLKDAKTLLKTDYSASNGERIRPNAYAASALLSRVYLFVGDWQDAASESATILNDASDYQLAPDLNSVFLPNSSEAIWQLMPVRPGQNTWEAPNFILSTIPTSVALSPELLNSFEPGDNRKIDWINNFISADDTFYFPYKYKITNSESFDEYEMVLRLAEQYLIHAEASVYMQNVQQAQIDLNTIRERAGLNDMVTLDPQVLLNAIRKERQTELFTEWGDRWFTLKRTQTAATVLAPIKGPSWQETDTLLPIPTTQLQNDPNIRQNPGY